jgi:hypothetical protein
MNDAISVRLEVLTASFGQGRLHSYAKLSLQSVVWTSKLQLTAGKGVRSESIGLGAAVRAHGSGRQRRTAGAGSLTVGRKASGHQRSGRTVRRRRAETLKTQLFGQLGVIFVMRVVEDAGAGHFNLNQFV